MQKAGLISFEKLCSFNSIAVVCSVCSRFISLLCKIIIMARGYVIMGGRGYNNYLVVYKFRCMTKSRMNINLLTVSNSLCSGCRAVNQKASLVGSSSWCDGYGLHFGILFSDGGHRVFVQDGVEPRHARFQWHVTERRSKGCDARLSLGKVFGARPWRPAIDTKGVLCDIICF